MTTLKETCAQAAHEYGDSVTTEAEMTALVDAIERVAKAFAEQVLRKVMLYDKAHPNYSSEDYNDDEIAEAIAAAERGE